MGILGKARSFLYKQAVRMKQKTYAGRLHYILERSKGSRDLVVVFSGFTPGPKARYNYMRTLAGIPCNKLFILDDFGYENKGSYYVGENGDYYVMPMVIALIEDVKKRLNIQTVMTAGSSKGGTAALLFGLHTGAQVIIAGAPQYYIGNYLSSEKHKPILEAICGQDPRGKDFLNGLISGKLEEIGNKGGWTMTVYLHFSKLEHTYEEHIKALIDALEQTSLSLVFDEGTYLEHSEVGNYFTAFLRKAVLENLQRK